MSTSLNELKAVPSQALEALEADNWTIEELSTASVKELTGYSGIGKATGQKIIVEAQSILDKWMLTETESLDRQAQLEVMPADAIIRELIDDGLTLQVIALSPVKVLEGHRGISRELAAKVISRAMEMVNERGLLESKGIVINDAPYKKTFAGFPEEWLSGAVEPPPMSVRVKRVFDQAKAEYEAGHG